MGTDVVCKAGTTMPSLGTFSVKVKFTGVADAVFRTYGLSVNSKREGGLRWAITLTAATTVRFCFSLRYFAGLKQL